MLSWFNVFPNVGKLSIFKRTILDMSWEVFRGSRRRKGRKCNTSWEIYFLEGEEQQNFLPSVGFCYLLVNALS